MSRSAHVAVAAALSLAALLLVSSAGAPGGSAARAAFGGAGNGFPDYVKTIELASTVYLDEGKTPSRLARAHRVPRNR